MFFYLLVFFLLGSAVGSFLNVVIDRTTRGESIKGRSYCDHCRATLSTLDLIPILSFVALGARCRYCKKPLKWQYPAIEFITASLFTLSTFMLVGGGNFNLITLFYYLLIVSVLIVVAVVDFRYYLIPTTFVYTASLVALFYNFIFLSQSAFLEHTVAAFLVALFFLIIILVTRGKGMGQGDIVLGFLIGLVLGYAATAVALFLAFLLGAVVSIGLIAFGKKRFGQTVPFAPFLISGFFISLYWQAQIIDWYFQVLY